MLGPTLASHLEAHCVLTLYTSFRTFRATTKSGDANIPQPGRVLQGGAKGDKCEGLCASHEFYRGMFLAGLSVVLTQSLAEPAVQCPLDSGSHVILVWLPVGQLDLLPAELIDQMLLLLDIPTLTTFSRVNQRAMYLVDSLQPYQLVWTHCPDVVRAAVSINACSFSCETLFQTPTREKCDFVPSSGANST
jgi:hypothetical protein